MPTTLKNLHDQVSSALGRGTSFDARIPDCVRRAARDLEIEFSFNYMQQFASLALVDMTAENLQELFGDLIKKFIYVKAVQVGADGAEYSCAVPKSQLVDLTARYDTIADYFTSMQYVTRYDFGWYAFTDWPESVSASPDLLQSYESLLKAASIVTCATDLRDDALLNFWTNAGNPRSYTSLRAAALLAEQEAENAAESLVMQPWVM